VTAAEIVLGQKQRGKRTPAKLAHSTAMWRASLILQKSREAMARNEMDIAETSQASVHKIAVADTATEQVTTTGWHRQYSYFIHLFRLYDHA